MESLSIPLDEKSYRVEIEWGLLEEVGEKVLEELGTDNLVLLTDRTVWGLYGDRVVNSFQKAGANPLTMVVNPGESSKSLDQASDLYSKMSESGVDRSYGLIAFGGGVVGDLGGFVASTYMRGVPYIQVPTTLLAQVDSSVGGKTAVNLPEGKNLVGSFYQPRYVGIDPSVLDTLSGADLRSGLGEMIKSGLLRSEELFRKAVEYSSRIPFSVDRDCFGPLIKESLEIKADIVSTDQRDRGIRRILNLGHTVGHGLEAACGFEGLRHGEAVLWGLIGELWISGRRGLLPSKKVEDIADSILETGIPSLPKGMESDSLIRYISRDKKVREGKQKCVLLEEIGKKARVEEISEDEIEGCLNYLDTLNGGNLFDFGR